MTSKIVTRQILPAEYKWVNGLQNIDFSLHTGVSVTFPGIGESFGDKPTSTLFLMKPDSDFTLFVRKDSIRPDDKIWFYNICMVDSKVEITTPDPHAIIPLCKKYFLYHCIENILHKINLP